MDFSKVVNKKTQQEIDEQQSEDDWKWLYLKDKEGIKLYWECLRLDERENHLLDTCNNIQKWRHAEWERDREYRKSQGEMFYECD
tara:strand:+ start:362 stop:616 length:255 start_codon:yes stop_codon:yes gene_type:complete